MSARRRGLRFPLGRWYVKRLREGRVIRIWFLGDSHTLTESTYGTVVYESRDRSPDAWRTSIDGRPDRFARAANPGEGGVYVSEPWRAAKRVPSVARGLAEMRGR